ncbi:MAG: RNA polymerase sigma-70 factor [Odoribacteraceae bacterium]|nr:RNA polymerase sigma-70 factor [Odoribacteraceae bacterium]
MEKRDRVDREEEAPFAPGGDGRGRFEHLFKTYYAPLCDYSHAILGDYAEAEDVVQDLFTHLWNHREEIGIQGSINSYLYASVRYRALNVLKHKAVMARNNPMLVDFIENVLEEGYSEEEELKIAKINEVLGSLPPRCRAIFTMSCLEGKKYGEIADELGISINTVKFHVKKAYKEIHAAVHPIPGPLLVLLAIKNRF